MLSKFCQIFQASFKYNEQLSWRNHYKLFKTGLYISWQRKVFHILSPIYFLMKFHVKVIREYEAV